MHYPKSVIRRPWFAKYLLSLVIAVGFVGTSFAL